MSKRQGFGTAARWTAPVGVGIVRDADGNIKSPTDPEEIKQALAREAAMERFKESRDINELLKVRKS